MASSRAEQLDWIKTRAKSELNGTDAGRQAAMTSMMSDLGKDWGGDGKLLYEDADMLQTLFLDAALFRKTDTQMLNWIDGFN